MIWAIDQAAKSSKSPYSETLPTLGLWIAQISVDIKLGGITGALAVLQNNHLSDFKYHIQDIGMLPLIL